MPRFFGKRPRLSKPDTLELARQEIQFATEYRDQIGVPAKWRSLIDAYQGKYLDPDQSEFEDEIVINYAFATANVIWPSVSVKEPTISVLPRQPEDEDRAVLTEALLNYEWEKLGVQRPMRAAAWDYVTLGIGWVKVGWEFREIETEMTDDEQLQEISRRIMEADTQAQMAIDTADQLPSDEEIASQVLGSKKRVVTQDDPYAEYVSPFDMLVNAEATSLDDARWIAHRQIRTLEEVKADKSYNKRVRSVLVGESVLRQGLGLQHDDQRRFGDQIDRVVVWELWDLERQKMMAFSEQSDDFLVAPMAFPYQMGHPFKLIRNYVSTGRFYPQGDIEQILPLVQELNATRSQMLNHRRKGNRKWLAREEAFTEDGRAALESSKDNQVAFVKKGFQGNLSDVMMPVPQVPLMADVYAIDDRLSMDINTISGVSEYQRGGSPDTRQTATEAAMIQDATNARQAEKLSQIELFISDIASGLLGVMQQFMTEHRDVRAVGRLGGDPLWFQADADDIKGQYLFKVQAGSTQPTNETTRRTNAITMMQLLAPWTEQGLVDPVQLLKHVLIEGFDVRQPEKFFTPPAVQQLSKMNMVAGGEADQGGGQVVGNDPNLQGAQGVQAPQMDPREILALQQSTQTINGIPDQLTDQLSAQVGLNLGGV